MTFPVNDLPHPAHRVATLLGTVAIIGTIGMSVAAVWGRDIPTPLTTVVTAAVTALGTIAALVPRNGSGHHSQPPGSALPPPSHPDLTRPPR